MRYINVGIFLIGLAMALVASERHDAADTAYWGTISLIGLISHNKQRDHE